MSSLGRIVIMGAALAAPLALAQDANSIAQATEAANAWLALSDRGDAAATWEQAAGGFQKLVSKPAWEHALRAARGPFGAVQSRQLSSATFTRSLPGAPDGQYVVIQYATRFENKAQAVETVTPQRQEDGSWKVSGYFVK